MHDDLRHLKGYGVQNPLAPGEPTDGTRVISDPVPHTARRRGKTRRHSRGKNVRKAAALAAERRAARVPGVDEVWE